VAFLNSENSSGRDFLPSANVVLRALSMPLAEVRVLVVGQDPYPTPGSAVGLAFAVAPHLSPLPASLRNVFTELVDDVSASMPATGDLTPWASQGVLLLNATLTVQAHQAGSHQGKGWETFTDAVIHILSERCNNLVFMLWGNYAQKKGSIIDSNKHLVLKTVHPSPLSAYRGFIGCGHFSAANKYLIANGKEPVIW
jgi:uracil-DNA glycosylase